MCNRGSQGCPGNVPLDANTQCKSHRILARFKAKLAAANGARGDRNCWIRAVNTFSAHIRQKECPKECCRLHPQQVFKIKWIEIIVENTFLFFSWVRLTCLDWRESNQMLWRLPNLLSDLEVGKLQCRYHVSISAIILLKMWLSCTNRFKIRLIEYNKDKELQEYSVLPPGHFYVAWTTISSGQLVTWHLNGPFCNFESCITKGP